MSKLSSEVLEITDVDSGYSIVCTADHKIFTKNRGYVCASDLTETDELLVRIKQEV
jgi:intein/homing endonuclease